MLIARTRPKQIGMAAHGWRLALHGNSVTKPRRTRRLWGENAASWPMGLNRVVPWQGRGLAGSALLWAARGVAGLPSRPCPALGGLRVNVSRHGANVSSVWGNRGGRASLVYGASGMPTGVI